MKKLLAMVLALVMTMSLVTISSNAAYTDAADIDNIEAVEVMGAVGVLQGDDKGAFNSTGILTREEAATIIAKMMLGADGVKALPAVSSFSDVAANRWSAPVIAYCAEQGIIAGNGDGTFNPTGKLTGYAFAKMCLVALGYKAQNEGYTGADWAVNVAKQVVKINLNDNVAGALSAEMTRQDAAQMAFNALTSVMVEYDGGTNITTGDGTAIVIDAKLKNVTNNGLAASQYNNIADGLTQFCERYFSKLTCTTIVDDMGRPATQWALKNEALGSYATAADYTVVISKSGKTVAQWVDKEMKKDFTYTADKLFVNGDEVKTSPSTNYTENTLTLQLGDVMEIYMDANTANKVAAVSVTRYTVDKVEAAVATKGTGKDAEVRIPGIIGYTDVDDVKGYEALAKDDVVYYYQDDGGVYHFAKADVFQGKLTSYNTKTDVTYTIDGNGYQVAEYAGAITGLTTGHVFNTAYNYFTDGNGYIIAAKAVEETSKDYVVVQSLAYVGATGVAGNDYVEARLVKMDGTTEVVKIAKIDTLEDIKSTDLTSSSEQTTAAGTHLVYDTETASGAVRLALDSTTKAAIENKVAYTYSTNSDGEYILKAAARTELAGGNVQVKTGAAQTATTIYTVDENTVFVVAKTSGGNKFSVYTGKAAAPNVTSTNTVVVKNDKSVAEYVYISEHSGTSFTENAIFLLSSSAKATAQEKISGTNYTYGIYDAIVDGNLAEVKVLDSATGTPAVQKFDPTYDTNGFITALGAGSNADSNGVTNYAVSGTTFTAAGEGYNFSGDELVIFRDTDGKLTEMTMAELSKDDNDTVYVVKTSATNPTVKYVYIVEVADDDTGATWVFAKVTANSFADGTLDGSVNETGTITVTLAGGATMSNAVSSDTGKATVATANNVITVTIKESGTTNITFDVTASDGTVASKSIAVTVAVSV